MLVSLISYETTLEKGQSSILKILHHFCQKNILHHSYIKILKYKNNYFNIYLTLFIHLKNNIMYVRWIITIHKTRVIRFWWS